MAWRVAKSLLTLRDQVDALYPGRDKSNDGTVGDTSHQAGHSDHNPNQAGVVCAMDITHDPSSGCDSYKLAEQFRKAKDPRVQYAISNRKIANADIQDWAWRPYTGANPHDHHVHISVRQNAKLYDAPGNWDLGEPIAPVGKPQKPKHATVKIGSKGEDVKRVQYLVGVTDDGNFGPKTAAAVSAYQAANGLVADGVVGPYTWDKLDALSEPWKPLVGAQPAAPTGRKVLFSVTGKISTFGGPHDTGMSATEGLALFRTEQEMVEHGLAGWLISASAAGVPGLGRRLKTTMLYLACRWNTDDYPILRDAVAHVSANGKAFEARPVDWGPNVNTGRVADLSPALAQELGLETNGVCSVVVYEDGK